MIISANFKLAEFEVSAIAIRNGIDNKIPESKVPNIVALVENVLQPLRDKFGPITITSGYRCPKLNALVKGSRTSQHMQAEAADIKLAGVYHYMVCEWIRDNLKFDQLIYEYGEQGWIHVSYRKDRLRGDVKSKVSGVKGYKAGLVKDG